ncbi:MAG: glycoside hydrolase domain-containing protein [Planctomycetota bacterium]
MVFLLNGWRRAALGIVIATLAVGGVVLSRVAAADRAGSDAGTVILDVNSGWRCFFAWKSELVRTAEGKLEPLVAGDKDIKKVEIVKTSPPSKDWVRPEFDDGGWTRWSGIIYGWNRDLALVGMRGRFSVADPGRVQDMKLSVTFYGGAVVYLNGKEVGRSGMPDGEIDPETPAKDYPKEAYVTPDDRLLGNFRGSGDLAKYPDRYELRKRNLAISVSASVLRKGVNVLALELHRAPVDAAGLVPAPVKSGLVRGHNMWTMLQFRDLRLTAAANGAVMPNAGCHKGLQVWTAGEIPAFKANIAERGDTLGLTLPILLVGTRGGAFSGYIGVGSSDPIHGLKVQAGELKGARTGEVLPAGAVRLRYTLADGDPTMMWGDFADHGPGIPRAPCFDGLDEIPPAEVAVTKEVGGAVEQVWVTVCVPRAAKADTYNGKLTVSAEGAPPSEVPIEIKVHDWLMPDPREFESYVGIILSPESVARKYGVAMWSDEHWKLVEKSFRISGEVGNKTVYVPLIVPTHFGNEHTMVRWIKQADGSYTHDFKIVEKYLDLAVKYLGKPPVVCFYVWEPYFGGTYFGSTEGPGYEKIKPRGPRPVKFTQLDPATGNLSIVEGPAYGIPESPVFWKPVFDGLRAILEKRGLKNSLMVGLGHDTRPTKSVVEDLKAAVPDARWVIHTHGRCHDWMLYKIQPVGAQAEVWFSPGERDPGIRRLYGWKNEHLYTTFPRVGSGAVDYIYNNAALGLYRASIEGIVISGIRGADRLGGEFWEVPVAEGKRSVSLLGFDPSTNWGALNVSNAVSHLLAPGKDGPVATIRLEAIRQGVQETEARIFLEKALVDPGKKANLGEDLAKCCQELLDERTRAILKAIAGGPYGDAAWMHYMAGANAHAGQLYAAAAEVAGRLGNK